MNFWDAIILGIVEGLTEFLPVSSTGHLILMGNLMGLEQTEFLKTFEIAIQLGAILSVAVIYYKSLFVNFEMMQRLAMAFLPTAILGFIFYKIIKEVFLESEKLIVWSLLIGGVAIILFEWKNIYKQKEGGLKTEKIEKEITLKKAFWIGVFQALAMIPGVSRSGATIIGGMAMGVSRKNIVEFSFLLAFPTMLAATVLDVLKNQEVFNSDSFGLLLWGFIVSFGVALLSIKFLIGFVKKHTFIGFGVYRIILAILFFIFIL